MISTLSVCTSAFTDLKNHNFLRSLSLRIEGGREGRGGSHSSVIEQWALQVRVCHKFWQVSSEIQFLAGSMA